MAYDDQGWNPLSRNPNGFMTDQFDLGNGLECHHTLNFPDPCGDIGKSHTTFDLGPQQIKIYPSGQTSLHNT